MNKLSKQELHNLAMNFVGEKLAAMDYEFIAVNSRLYKHPQFVCTHTEKKRIFVLVKAVSYPDDPDAYDEIWMQSFLEHARKHQARVLYAGVGLAKADKPEEPLTQNDDFLVNFKGFKTLLP